MKYIIIVFCMFSMTGCGASKKLADTKINQHSETQTITSDSSLCISEIKNILSYIKVIHSQSNAEIIVFRERKEKGQPLDTLLQAKTYSHVQEKNFLNIEDSTSISKQNNIKEDKKENITTQTQTTEKPALNRWQQIRIWLGSIIVIVGIGSIIFYLGKSLLRK